MKYQGHSNESFFDDSFSYNESFIEEENDANGIEATYEEED